MSQWEISISCWTNRFELNARITAIPIEPVVLYPNYVNVSARCKFFLSVLFFSHSTGDNLWAIISWRAPKHRISMLLSLYRFTARSSLYVLYLSLKSISFPFTNSYHTIISTSLSISLSCLSVAMGTQFLSRFLALWWRDTEYHRTVVIAPRACCDHFLGHGYLYYRFLRS